MTLPVQTEVERRIALEKARRSRWAGYVFVAAAAIVTTVSVVFDGPFRGLLPFSGVFVGLAYAYLRAARALEDGRRKGLDSTTRSIVNEIERSARKEGRREVVGGALSVSDEPGGQVSIAGDDER